MLEDILESSIPTNSNVVLLVSGFDYSTKELPVDFAAAAFNCLRRVNTNAAVPLTSTQIVLELVFAEGIVRLQSLHENVLYSAAHHCFSPPGNDGYRQTSNTRYYSSITSRTLSMSDVYFILLWVGKFRASAITQIIFASHAWDCGPIFLNSFDPFPSIPWRSPCDKDGRIKDLVSPQLGDQEAALIRSCFHPEAVAINLGCGGSTDAKQILLGRIKNCRFFPVELETLKQARSKCWNQLFANAFHVPCYGAFPGFPTCMELDQAFPTLSVPQSTVLDRLDYSRLLIYIQLKLKLTLDPWGLGLVKFEPYEFLLDQ